MKIAAAISVGVSYDVLPGLIKPSITLLMIASPLQAKVNTATGTSSATIHLINSVRISLPARSPLLFTETDMVGSPRFQLSVVTISQHLFELYTFSDSC